MTIIEEKALPTLTHALEAELRRSEGDRNGELLRAIASGLRTIAIPATIPLLLSLLRSRHEGAASLAAEGLMEMIPVQEIIPVLTASLWNDDSGWLSSDSLSILRKIPKALDALPSGTAINEVEGTAEVLTGMITRELPDFLKEEVATILGRLGDPAIPAITRGLQNANDWQIRRQLIRALSAMQSQYTTPFLTSAVRDDYAHVRIEAVAGLRRLGTAEALAAVMIEAATST